MKMEKISERDLKALLGLGMLLIAAAAYFIGFRVLLTSTSAVKAQNVQLEARLNDLKIKEQNKEQTIKETDEYNAKIDEIIAKFPSKVTTERVLYDLNGLQKNLGKMRFESANLEMNGLFYPNADATATTEADSTSSTTDATATDTTTDTTGTTTSDAQPLGYSDGVITVYRSKVTTSVKNLSYAALKTLIEEVHNYDGRLTLDSVNLSFSSETGLLEGEVIFDFYALEGSPNEYKVPDLSDIPVGLKDIFGTFSKN